MLPDGALAVSTGELSTPMARGSGQCGGSPPGAMLIPGRPQPQLLRHCGQVATAPETRGRGLSSWELTALTLCKSRRTDSYGGSQRQSYFEPGDTSAPRMERSALIAAAVWVCTDPRLMPMTEATRASLISP